MEDVTQQTITGSPSIYITILYTSQLWQPNVYVSHNTIESILNIYTGISYRGMTDISAVQYTRRTSDLSYHHFFSCSQMQAVNMSQVK